MQIGLRVDVDTLRGTRKGVPVICRSLAEYGWQASFFFSVGPDNMGRHLWRLVRPRFLLKMLRSNAPALYGWDILLRGVFWPGPMIGPRCATVIRDAASAVHEIGLHAWDHQAWQARVERWPEDTLLSQIQRGYDLLTDISGRPPVASAVPGWRCTPQALVVKDKFPFTYNSDCRGKTMFYPRVNDHRLRTPQVPVNLPTYDELIGRDGVSPANYNQCLLDMIQPNSYNVLTIHAEVEGIAAADLFRQFLAELAARGGRCCPLGEILAHTPDLPEREMAAGSIPGREGWVAVVR